jgi:bifunctional non-homologous end joining protein LigD
MLARISEGPFSHPDWVFEVKWDGIRCLLHLSGGRVRLQARSLNEITRQYPELRDGAGGIDAEAAVIDGEIVALDGEGKPSFHLLQNRMHLQSDPDIEKSRSSIPITFYAFDLLHLDGEDMMDKDLLARKSNLQRVLSESAVMKYSDHVPGQGESFFEAAEEMGIEGVMAKRTDSRYEPGVRSPFWLKIRVNLRDDFVIGGWTPGKGGRRRFFGALLLGRYEGGKLHYVGKVGTGFDRRMMRDLAERLKAAETDENPFAEEPREAGARWTEPRMVCEVKYAGRSEDGLRFPVYLGLRPDKFPREAVQSGGESRQVLKEYKRVKLSNPDKVFWPDQGYTKADTFNYYLRVSDHILPHLRNRPLTLYRQPDGIEGESFFQRNRPGFTPAWVKSMKMARPGHTVIDAILCQNAETLAWLANLGCIELHPWFSRYDDPDHPDFIAFDLDPVSPARYGDACAVALSLHDILADIGFSPYVKTSGKRGLHVYLPIKRELSYEGARSFASEVGRYLKPKFPGKFTMSRRTEDKKGRVFLDPGQMGWSRSLAAPYSLRPTPEATVSTPITWEECESCVLPQRFNMATVPDRLDRLGDPWSSILRKPRRVGDVLEGG